MEPEEMIRKAVEIRDSLNRPELADIAFVVNRRLRNAAGRAVVKRNVLGTFRTVEISSQIFSVIGNESGFRNTILHELAHHIAGLGEGHGLIWRYHALKIGCDGKRCHTLAINGVRRTVLTCTACGQDHKPKRGHLKALRTQTPGLRLVCCNCKGLNTLQPRAVFFNVPAGQA